MAKSIGDVEVFKIRAPRRRNRAPKKNQGEPVSRTETWFRTEQQHARVEPRADSVVVVQKHIKPAGLDSKTERWCKYCGEVFQLAHTTVHQKNCPEMPENSGKEKCDGCKQLISPNDIERHSQVCGTSSKEKWAESVGRHASAKLGRSKVPPDELPGHGTSPWAMSTSTETDRRRH